MNPSDLPATSPSAPDSPDESLDFAALLKQNDRERAAAVSRNSGSKQIEGTVVAVSADTVFIDISYKTEGILPLSAFANDASPVEPGAKVRVTVRGRNADGYYELTRQRGAAATAQDYASLEEAFEAKGVVSGTVTGLVKGGLTVDIGMRAFLPASRSGTRDAAEMEALVGQPVRVRITQLDLEGGESKRPDAIVDRRSVLEEESRASADLRFSELAEGQNVQGTVRSHTDYGAFVDIGGTDALLHISDMSWHRIATPAEAVAVGDTIEAQVLKIDNADPARRRISIGLKQLQPHPWDSVASTYHAGDKVNGIVTRTTDFGAFVELSPGIGGLIHISEMAWGKKVRKPSDVVNPGDQVEAIILGIDAEARRLSLGLKQALGDPWVEFAERVHAGSTVSGPVTRMAPFGAFVEVAPGIEGLVHISEISSEKRLNHPSEALRTGETVQAKVLEVDREKRQLRLSIKGLEPTGADEFFQDYKAGDQLTGRVLSVDAASRTARVQLGDGILATCALPQTTTQTAASSAAPAGGPVDLSQLGSLLSSRWKTTTAPKKGAPAVPQPASAPQPLEPGQLRSFRIQELDAEKRTVSVELAS